jgi:hypothetical protein
MTAAGVAITATPRLHLNNFRRMLVQCEVGRTGGIIRRALQYASEQLGKPRGAEQRGLLSRLILAPPKRPQKNFINP